MTTSPLPRIRPVILSGGSGTRLWPVSRTDHPKQFHDLTGGGTMFELTLSRLSGERFDDPVIVCNAAHRQLVLDTCEHAGIRPSHVILEPVGRNTAPAIALAALQFATEDPEAILLVAASDNTIRDMDSFARAVGDAFEAACRNRIVAFGIRPTHPETGYGYIRRGTAIDGLERVFEIDRYVEKPDAKTADAYLASGEYAWNSGMFMLRVSVFLDELARQRPDILEACKAALEGSTPGEVVVDVDEATFAAIDGESMDYAVMEGCERGAVVEAAFDWNDVGSWQAIWDISPKDGDSNVSVGDATVLDSAGCLVRAEPGTKVSIIGCEDLVVVTSGDQTLVMPRSRSQDVKRLADKSG